MATKNPSPRSYEQWTSLLSSQRLPAAIVDMDVFDTNIDTITAMLTNNEVTIRLDTSSIRCTALMRHIIERCGPSVRGLLTFSPHETAMLAELGFDDFLCASPPGRRDEAREIARLNQAGRCVVATVDDSHHLRLLSEAAQEHDTTIGVCIELDVSWRPLGDVHLGARRSPLRDSEQVRAFARIISDTPNLRLDGLLARELQVSTVPDRTPGDRLNDPIRGIVKAQSRTSAADRRMASVTALQEEGFELAFVVGGGTGSLASTVRDPAITQIALGSGFCCPHQADGFTSIDLAPALFAALGVIRTSDTDHVTCAGGAYLADGPPTSRCQPVVHRPRGVDVVTREGFGAEQTAFKLVGEARPDIGDPIICRPPSTEALLERADRVLLVRGDTIEATAPTYRGLGGTYP